MGAIGFSEKPIAPMGRSYRGKSGNPYTPAILERSLS